MNRNKAIFLDRDGTILNELGYLVDPKKMVFYASAYAPLRKLQKAGFRLVVVSNQSAVGRGYMTLAQLGKINRHFKKKLKAEGVRIDGIYFCPHLPDAGCSCRKPRPGMVRRAAREMILDLKRSYLVGDQLADMKVAQAVRIPGLLVLTGHGRAMRRKAGRLASKVVPHLSSAAQWILSHSELR